MIFDNYELRLLQRDDKKCFFQLIKNNIGRLEDFVVGIVAQTKTEDDVENFINNSIIKILNKSYYPYLVIDLKTKKPIGFVDIKNIDWNIPKAELGFFIDENYTGKGISTKAIIHLSEYLFDELKFNKLLLRIHQSNKSSIGVAEKCGFEFEGIIKNDYKTTKGKIVDFRYYGKVKS
ncbi:GNAT family N-acetyltransferase [Flavobacterium sp. 5]|uniref:GNAT family N-acetyltransferase n=1 Tax=Flavobacterium sp. 5 TaxID=2035199 RepID=UPI000C2C057A|nr:GNAT family protein [Flavobacterium sp. 5]PKB15102.1 RimJ/RimL family protein N-acetyltransferase [Flavobacterium sp. 5]